jgi:hypothetical protein
MSKIIFFFLAIAFNANLFGQTISVPYRVGNKFGISDQNGKILIPAQFDIVEISSYNETYFEAFTFKENEILSSYIYKNKIILSNQKYSSYQWSNDFVIATKYKSGNLSSYHTDGEAYYTDYEHLYTKEGKLIIGGDVLSVFSNDIDDDKELKEELISVVYKDKKHSLFLYDKKLKKITQTFFEKSDYLKVKYNNEYDYTDKSIVYTFKDAAGKGKQIKIDVVKDGIKIVSTEDFDLNPKKTNNREIGDDYFRDTDIVAEPYYEAKKEVSPLAILDIRRIEIKSHFYYSPKKVEEIEFANFRLGGDCYVLEKNGKKGMYCTNPINDFIIPQEYDDILNTEMAGYGGIFLLKKNNKYGFYISNRMSESGSYFIETIFDKIALIEAFDYFGKNQPLIKLFDENNKFFCYADKTGKLYYSEK